MQGLRQLEIEIASSVFLALFMFVGLHPENSAEMR
jgi:hypothetical protein